MASPVDTSVKHMTSDMGAAMPPLNGTPGSMIGLLDAFAVNGVDLKALVSLVVANGIATATWTGTHSATVDSVVLVAGVTGTLVALNGEQKVLSKTATTLTFATAAADGTAGGSISIKMAPLGWEKVYAGTNKAVYRSQDVQGTRMYLRVDDAGTQTCRVVAYESMSDVDTGIGQFPTELQAPGGGYWSKSSAASSVANRWGLFGDSRMLYWHPLPYSGQNALGVGGMTRGFGDLIAYRPSGDAYAAVLNFSASSSYDNVTSSLDGFNAVAQTAMPRAHSGLGSSQLNINNAFTCTPSNLSGLDDLFGAFPSNIDGSMMFSRRYVASALTQPPRGELPGLLHVPQKDLWGTFKFGNKRLGAGSLAGRTLMAVSPSNAVGSTSAGTNTGAMFIDVTGPWR